MSRGIRSKWFTLVINRRYFRFWLTPFLGIEYSPAGGFWLALFSRDARRLGCPHDWYWDTNIYGDEINRVSLRKVYRSRWWCRKCGKFECREKLYLPSHPTMREMT